MNAKKIHYEHKIKLSSEVGIQPCAWMVMTHLSPSPSPRHPSWPFWVDRSLPPRTGGTAWSGEAAPQASQLGFGSGPWHCLSM